MAFNKDNFDNIMSRLKNIKIQSTDIFLGSGRKLSIKLQQ